MEKTQERYDGLCNEKAAKENEKALVEGDIESIDNQIKTLKEAYKDIDEAIEEIRKCRNIVKGAPEFWVNIWEGQVAEEVYTSCESGDLFEAYKSYINMVDIIRDKLNKELTKLENKRNEKYGILGELISAINNLWTDIQNYWN